MGRGEVSGGMAAWFAWSVVLLESPARPDRELEYKYLKPPEWLDAARGASRRPQASKKI